MYEIKKKGSYLKGFDALLVVIGDKNTIHSCPMNSLATIKHSIEANPNERRHLILKSLHLF